MRRAIKTGVSPKGSPKQGSPKRLLPAMFGLGLLAGGACTGDAAAPGAAVTDEELVQRAYVVSKESDELTVIDLRTERVIAKVPTGGRENHMAELNGDFSKVYVNSAHTNETIVVDARSLKVTKRIAVSGHPGHLSTSRDGKLLAVMAEEDDAVVFIDTASDEVVKRLRGFHTPHFLRFAPDGQRAFVANRGAHHVSEVDLATLEIEGHVALDGFAGPPSATLAAREGGFADVQIDERGILFAAHASTGRVLVYDTTTNRKLPDLTVGKGPWVVFAEHPFRGLPLRHLVPNFAEQTVSLIDGGARAIAATLPGDEEAYGVNFSSRTPGTAFVMNRGRKDVAVVDTDRREIVRRIPVGGNTETASTTPDGRLIVATVSGANKVVLLDPQTQAVVRAFPDVGRYPWSVTIPKGQNYCH